YYLSPTTPHLHPFPTRRSSDLFRPLDGKGDARGVEVDAERVRALAVPRPGPRPDDWPSGEDEGQVLRLLQRDEGDHVGAQDDERSEEHTSELQSRFDLVCRLLL